eukprot:g4020.t1
MGIIAVLAGGTIALMGNFGEGAKVQKAETEINSSLAAALRQYETLAGQFPTTEQGLMALSRSPGFMLMEAILALAVFSIVITGIVSALNATASLVNTVRNERWIQKQQQNLLIEVLKMPKTLEEFQEERIIPLDSMGTQATVTAVPLQLENQDGDILEGIYEFQLSQDTLNPSIQSLYITNSHIPYPYENNDTIAFTSEFRSEIGAGGSLEILQYHYPDESAPNASDFLTPEGVMLLRGLNYFVALTSSVGCLAVELGERANWLRGAWGGAWTPSNMENGRVETVSIDDFITQISGLNTIGYIQVKLSGSYIYSPVHHAPHALLESLWEGDTDANGDPINLVVPRASSGVDPFLNWLTAIRAAGLKTQVYVNSSNMLERSDTISNPASIPEITARWKAFCDTDPDAVSFVNNHPYLAAGDPENRKYMFCYAEFVLKEYAMRYGDLIDGWIFDSADFMVHAGDSATSGDEDDQRVFEAFADAVHAGNPYAAVAFNNGPNRETGAGNGVISPFTPATHHDDYMFGHPYNGGKNLGRVDNGNYARNFSIVEWIEAKSGNVHKDYSPWTFDDKVVGHFYPPMSTTSWAGGSTPALANADFNLWNEVAINGGGSITWGLPLDRANASNPAGPIVTVKDWAYSQLTEMDTYMSSRMSGLFGMLSDIGSPGQAGTANYTRSNGRYIVRGGGSDIYGWNDSFYFPSKYHAGNGEIVARVNSVQDTNTWAKAGVMFRGSSATNSANVMVAVRPDRLVTMQYRSNTNGKTVSLGTFGNTTDAKWVKLVRDGSLFTGYYSTDGEAWTKIQEVTIAAIGDTALVGLPVTSHNDSTRCRVAFYNVSISSRPMGYFTSAVNIGDPALAGGLGHGDNAYVLDGTGSDITGTADQFFFASQLRGGNQTITARVLGVENTNSWAKGGIMIRESLDADAKHVMVAVRPNKKVYLLYRNSTGGVSVSSSVVGDTVNPKWIRLVRSGNVFTGSYSIDGSNWTTVATQTVNMDADVEVGLATTSRNVSKMCTATFDQVMVE